tara:strand:- start:80756 stop:81475 length:720 start_codon:yes stop_codon:yes gene_type:complete
MLVTTKAIVISSVKYSEADLIVKCFTEASGIKTYLLKGIRKSKKGKLRASQFQPLSLLEITANHRDKGSLEYIKEAKAYYSFQSLHYQIVKSSLVLFLSEVLKQTIQEEEKNHTLFKFLEHSFMWLDQNEAPPNFHLLFLLNLSDHFGFYPDTGSTDKPVFNLAEGIFQDETTSLYCASGIETTGLKQLFGLNFDSLDTIKLTKQDRAQCLKILLLYYQLHIYGFKTPKSLAVLNQIFD